MKFKFDNFTTTVHITNELPKISLNNAVFVCDENTKQYADALNCNNPVCVLKSGEENKNWQAVEKVIRAAKDAKLGRDGILFGIGGGVIGDLTGFAASIYMRGCRLQLLSTTLLAMVDASIGGKTGFDLFDIKNFAGSFYPAETVYMPLDTLKTLPEREYKSGLAELIKTTILSGEINLKKFRVTGSGKQDNPLPFVKNAVRFKGKLVEKDFKEIKGKRALLNLGHTFGHALETAAGLGNITHGEAVAWGIVQACHLGVYLGITPQKRAEEIVALINSSGYDCSSPHSLAQTAVFKNALLSDKKNKHGKFTFIVPDKKSAVIVELKNISIIEKLLKDGYI